MVAKEKPAAPPEAEAPPEAAAQTHPAHLHPYAESSDGELYLDYGPMPPETYDRDVLVALPIHPTRMFVYWELSGPKGRELRASGRPWVLRCHDVDSGVSLEWEVEPGVGNYYVHVEPGHRYRFELGTLSAGDFTAVGATRPQLSPRTEGRRTGTGQEWAHVLHDVGPAGVRAVRRMEVTLKKGAPDLLGLYAKSAAEMLDVPGSRSLHSRKK
jgi:hypothetical protein